MSNLQQLTRQIQERLGVSVDGDYGEETARAILAKLPEPAPTPVTDAIDGIVIDARSAAIFYGLDPKIQPAFRKFYQLANIALAKKGFSYIAVQGTRTMAEQQALYDQGRSKPGNIVTKAKPGSSWHNFRVAVDFGVFRGKDYLDDSEPGLADRTHTLMAEAFAGICGLAWGGNWKSIKDVPHFQPAALPDSPNDHYRDLFDRKGSVL